jgi:hypothetical protein
MEGVSEASDDPNDMWHNETEFLLALKLSNLNTLRCGKLVHSKWTM